MDHQMKSFKSAAIRARLTHPVIDTDGHTIEFDQGVFDYLQSVGGHRLLTKFQSWGVEFTRWYRLSHEERRRYRPTRISWWVLPTKNTLDRATATLPKLRYERMEEIGIDFAIIYPTLGVLIPHINDEELRRGCCRAFNMLNADIYREHSYRMTPAAIIPMHTPDEAVEELEYCVKSLGMKVAMLASYVQRPLTAGAAETTYNCTWLDTFGIDSMYNYDKVWAKCLELKVVPTFHSTGGGWGSRISISNYMYNHIGSFAAVGEALCKSLFLGGVTRRFRQLKFIFLEGGVGWACSLYADLVSHWSKRNPRDIQNYNPKNLDFDALMTLYERYGGALMEGKIENPSKHGTSFGGFQEDPSMLDEWRACGITEGRDIYDLFVTNFYFGCEGDDRMNAWAFNANINPFNAKLKILLGSDIGHWDVVDAAEVIEEAYAIVESGLISDADFRDFVFGNPVACYGALNRDFFRGTAIEKHAAEQLMRSEII